MNPDYSQKIPIMQLRPGCLLFYDLSLYPRTSHKELSRTILSDQPTAEKYTGKLTASSTKKLRQAINLLIAQAPPKTVLNPSTDRYYTFKVNFITLTLSAAQQNVSDKTIKAEILAPWILNMKRNFNLGSYVWRAERQKNGNIHFHFVTDTFIPYDSIRDAWNHCQDKFHFIEAFRFKNKSAFPNSTDVHAIKNIRNLAAYIVKYMSKDSSQVDSIEGKVWDCSVNLKRNPYPCFEMSSHDFSLVNLLSTKFESRFHKSDFCSSISLNDYEMKKYLPAIYMQTYFSWLKKVHSDAYS